MWSTLVKRPALSTGLAFPTVVIGSCSSNPHHCVNGRATSKRFASWYCHPSRCFAIRFRQASVGLALIILSRASYMSDGYLFSVSLHADGLTKSFAVPKVCSHRRGSAIKSEVCASAPASTSRTFRSGRSRQSLPTNAQPALPAPTTITSNGDLETRSRSGRGNLRCSGA